MEGNNVTFLVFCVSCGKSCCTDMVYRYSKNKTIFQKRLPSTVLGQEALTESVAPVAEVSDGVHHFAGGRLVLGPAVDALQEGEDGEDERRPGGAEPGGEERGVIRRALQQRDTGHRAAAVRRRRRTGRYTRRRADRRPGLVRCWHYGSQSGLCLFHRTKAMLISHQVGLYWYTLDDVMIPLM